MSIQSQIQEKLTAALQPAFLEVLNESHNHHVPPNSETHFKVSVVSPAFAGKRAVARHQSIYQILSEELAGPVHALAIHAFTVEEWQDRAQQSPNSPNCLGGSK